MATLACLLLFVTAAVAQEHYTEGPVWRVTLVRVKPAQMDAYLTSLRQATKPLLEEEKRTGAIVDYKIFLKETNSGPQDWDLALAIEYKNHAAMDGLTAKGEAGRASVFPTLIFTGGFFASLAATSATDAVPTALLRSPVS